MATSPAARRVVVLGGGMAALTAAFELARLNKPDAAPRYRITVYQQGWRLGGKGASGRASANGRIEEHGLHIWFGAYENAFRTMRDVYATVPGKWPNGDLLEAFSPQFGFHLAEHREGWWSPWQFDLPRLTSSPADSGRQGDCTPWGMLPRVLERLREIYANHVFARLKILEAAHPGSVLAGVVSVPSLESLEIPLAMLGTPDTLASEALRGVVADALERFRVRLWATFRALASRTAPSDIEGMRVVDDLRRWTTIVCVGLAAVYGALRSEACVHNDWDRLNDSDLKEWLRDQLLGDAELAESALVTASYDLYFSYPAGDPANGSIETGTMLRAALWLLLEYKGAVMWRMRSAMGDTIFTPLYHALAAMDVEFKFFHKVTKLEAIDSRITSISIEQQASVKSGAYQPFVQDGQGDDCWPNRPLFEQLHEECALKAGWESGKTNLESDWATWKASLPPADIKLGPDDLVVCGLPLAVMGDVAGHLPEVQAMVKQVGTVETQATQLWLREPLSQLQKPAAHFADAPVLTTFENPIDTYADMTSLVGRESWPAGSQPEHIAYFCGVHAELSSVASTDPGYLAAATDGVEQRFESMFEQHVGPAFPGAPSMASLWPRAFRSGTMDWGLLCERGSATRPLEHQYWRANVNASDRYVIAGKNTSHARCAAHKSGYSNLFLAGDWIKNGLYVGCIEGAVIGGKQAARALSGDTSIEVVGEGNLFRRP